VKFRNMGIHCCFRLSRSGVHQGFW